MTQNDSLLTLIASLHAELLNAQRRIQEMDAEIKRMAAAREGNV